MKKHKWSDEQLEDLLSRMPKINDNRSKEEIFQNMTIKLNRRKQRVWLMPTAATAAALLLFFILAPNLFNWQLSEEKSMGDAVSRSVSEQMKEEKADNSEVAIESTEKEKSAESFDISNFDENEDKINYKSISTEDFSTAIYEEDLNGMEVLTYEIPDKNAEAIVPVSILVEKQENKSKFELFEENMENLREEEWGLSEYYPLKAQLSLDKDSRILTVDVPAVNDYDVSLTNENFFKKILTNTMIEYNIDKISLMTDGKPGIDFGHNGFHTEFVVDEKPGNHAFYFYYPNETNKKPFIIPFGEKISSITEALKEMKYNREVANLYASIPSELNFEAVENPEKQLLTLTFSEDSNLNNDESTVHTIEAILLTAKEFNYRAVKLENVHIEMIGRFNLNEEIKVPIAANKQQLPY
ncbi:hypothetical protein KDN24_00565 [Bacillus sp. Bva_UNVM-123]|uniref:hypothetical protein n=1 Tax=Bacillus sp. Bva_UNVM-123 TaxID=2829798 RepID=UPI00391F0C24